MADLMSVSLETFGEMAEYLHTPDLYSLLQANRWCFDNTLGLLYTAVQLGSPDSSKGLSFLKSLLDTDKPYRIEKLKELHVHGTSPEDTSTVPLGRDGSHLVEDLIQQCLFQSSDVSQDQLTQAGAAYRLFREAFYASTGIGRTLAICAALQGRGLTSLEWLVRSDRSRDLNTHAPTPVQLLRAAIGTRAQLGMPVFPALRKMVLFVDPRDTHVPLVQTLKRLVVSGKDDQTVYFDLAAVDGQAKDQLEELVVSEVDIVEPLMSHLNADYFKGLHTLVICNFTRYPSADYRPFVALLSAKCPELAKIVWDYNYVDFGDPPTPTPQQHQPELGQLTGIKHAKIHSQLLQASLSDTDFSGMGDSLPANLETLVLTGLNLNAYIAADDPFSLEQLCAPLKSLERVGLRFDFNEADVSALGPLLEDAQDTLRNIVAKGRSLKLRVGIYLFCMEAEELVEILHMGDDVQGEHMGEDVQAR